MTATATTVGNVCKMMARAIEQIKKDIRSKEDRVRILNQRLATLESQPMPDKALIKEVRKDIQDLEAELANDRPQLGAFEEEFSASCR